MQIFNTFTLEFRDEEPYFDGTTTMHSQGHEWFVTPYAASFCQAKDCQKKSEWVRWMIAHPDIAECQVFCNNHARGYAEQISTLYPVAAVRDFNDEFSSCKAEIRLDRADWPETDYESVYDWVVNGCPLKPYFCPLFAQRGKNP